MLLFKLELLIIESCCDDNCKLEVFKKSDVVNIFLSDTAANESRIEIIDWFLSVVIIVITTNTDITNIIGKTKLVLRSVFEILYLNPLYTSFLYI